MISDFSFFDSSPNLASRFQEIVVHIGNICFSVQDTYIGRFLDQQILHSTLSITGSKHGVFPNRRSAREIYLERNTTPGASVGRSVVGLLRDSARECRPRHQPTTD